MHGAAIHLGTVVLLDGVHSIRARAEGEQSRAVRVTGRGLVHAGQLDLHTHTHTHTHTERGWDYVTAQQQQNAQQKSGGKKKLRRMF